MTLQYCALGENNAEVNQVRHGNDDLINPNTSLWSKHTVAGGGVVTHANYQIQYFCWHEQDIVKPLLGEQPMNLQNATDTVKTMLSIPSLLVCPEMCCASQRNSERWVICPASQSHRELHKATDWLSSYMTQVEENLCDPWGLTHSCFTLD